MHKKKLILINPTLSNPFPGFPPLGLGYVAALTPDNWDVEIIDENFEIARFKECDLVGLTGFTAMANRAYQIAKMFKDKGVTVVMGGIHASMMPDEALQFVDTVVVGEVEAVWANVIADFESGNLLQKYEGSQTDLKSMVHPRRDLFHEDYFCDTIQTARGCPNDCEFCSVSQFNGFAYRLRPVQEVLDEMATLKKKFLFIVDDNIVGSGPQRAQRAIELARGMIERKFNFIWYSQTALNVADNEEVLEAFEESGCRLLFLGIESEDRKVLESMKKKVNIRRDYQTVFEKIHDHHIGIHGSLIFGTDQDDLNMLQKRLKFVLESHIDVIQYCTLTPYPGTRLFKRMYDEGRLFYTDFPADWDRYDLTEVLFKPGRMNVDEYRKMMKHIGTQVFNHKAIAKRFFRTCKDTQDFLTAFWCYLTNRLYRTPQKSGGVHGDKFWYLSSKSWPFSIYMNPEMEVHREHYRKTSSATARVADGV
jgi:radical SAM superfamily enzyme YgiQ (UPF0313 family)